MVLIALLGVLAAERLSDPVEIVKRLVDAEHHNREIARQYTYIQRSEEKEFDGDGATKKVESKTFDVSFLYGRPYSRLIAKNDQPLDEKTEEKEQEKLRKETEKRQSESEKDRQKQVERDRKQTEGFRKLVDEIGKAYDLKLEGMEKIEGRDVYRVSGTPRADYKRRTLPYSLLKKVRGTLWIDAEEFQIVNIDLEVIDSFSIGWVLARLSPGTRLHLEHTRVNGEVWLMKHGTVKIDVRVGLVKKLDMEVTTTWKDFRKFQTDSRVVDAAEVPEQ